MHSYFLEELCFNKDHSIKLKEVFLDFYFLFFFEHRNIENKVQNFLI